MAAYLSEHMSAALQQNPSPGEDGGAVLQLLAGLVRQGASGAFEALVIQLRPLLLRLAGLVQPEDPRDLVGAVYDAVFLRGHSTLAEIQSDITGFHSSKLRSKKRSRRKIEHLTLVHPTHQSAFTPGEVSILLKYLSPEDRALWIGVSQQKSLPQLAKELGWGIKKTEARWKALQERLRSTLDTEPK